MSVTLDLQERELGGVRLGSHRKNVLPLEVWDEEHIWETRRYLKHPDGGLSASIVNEQTGHPLDRPDGSLSVSLEDDVVISITARDECYFGDLDLIGMDLSTACEALGRGQPSITFGGEAVSFYAVDDGNIEMLVIDDRITQLTLSDYSLIPENDPPDD